MRNIKLIIEYLGGGYSGWQVQNGASSAPTVQGAIIAGIRKLTGEVVVLNGSSRTDAGVHALGQVANFRTSSAISLKNIMLGLNSVLPRDIVIRDIAEVPEGFDSRRDSKGKTYLYRVLNRPVRSPVAMAISWLIPDPLDVALMASGAAFFVGRKDFTSFRASGSSAPHSVREIFSFGVEPAGDGFIEFKVRGTAFLRHMVRIMVGTLVELGRGKLTLDEISAIIEARDRIRAPAMASPEGLYLIEVEY